MQVKQAIILSAGKGTRMGPIGEHLAKPVWPFFGSTLIELQIRFLKKHFGIKEFYINSHHLHEQLNFLESDEIKIVFEPNLLDQGGGVLNIFKKYNLWNTPVLINNSDQFYFISDKDYETALKKIEDYDAILFGLNVDRKNGYNKLQISNSGTLSGIVPNKIVKEKKFETYSGLSIIKSPSRNYENESLPFFKAIANFEDHPVYVHTVEVGEYYDFGKLDEYYALCMNVQRLIKESHSNELLNFLNIHDSNKYNTEYGLDFRSKESGKVPSDEIYLNEGRIFLKDGVVSSEVKR